MKKYETPQLVCIRVTVSDVISTSAQGTETNPYPDNEGVWDLDIG